MQVVTSDVTVLNHWVVRQQVERCYFVSELVQYCVYFLMVDTFSCRHITLPVHFIVISTIPLKLSTCEPHTRAVFEGHEHDRVFVTRKHTVTSSSLWLVCQEIADRNDWMWNANCCRFLPRCCDVQFWADEEHVMTVNVLCQNKECLCNSKFADYKNVKQKNKENNVRIIHIIIIYNTIISKTMFMVLSSWQSHCESSPGLFDECRTAPSSRWPKTKPDDLGCASACPGCRVYTHHRHLLLLLNPKADTHFTVPQRVEGWVDLAGWLHTETVYLSTDGHPSWY